MNNNRDPGLNTEEFRSIVSGKLTALKTESQDLSKEVEALQLQLAKNSQMISHLEGVLELSGTSETNSLPVARKASYDEVCDLVEQILAEKHKNPVHYRELADEVQLRGVKLGGKDPASTLVAMISKEPRFVRPTSRGFYALRKDYPNARNVGEHKRGNRKKEIGQ
ncbi:MAG: winged helix-turn-helix domain-containing protein [Anaerolineaceae bacterium]|nr:winged helix-turn-helix domain-containing protein [Anaerolineaceae bacterium]MDE0328953.1 winged helix-turn-helix domain-containing protein [Anaerolineaceae bacterium]